MFLIYYLFLYFLKYVCPNILYRYYRDDFMFVNLTYSKCKWCQKIENCLCAVSAKSHFTMFVLCFICVFFEEWFQIFCIEITRDENMLAILTYSKYKSCQKTKNHLSPMIVKAIHYIFTVE